LIDRIDLQVEVPAIKLDRLLQEENGEPSAVIRNRVENARAIQRDRFKKIRVTANAQLQSRHFEKYCPLNTEARKLLNQSFQNLKLSMRAHDRIIKVARTIADLANAEQIETIHIAEAVQYRSLDRQL